MHIFLTNTLRCLNTDFFHWLFRPGVVKITHRDVTSMTTTADENDDPHLLALYRQHDDRWDFLRGILKQNGEDLASDNYFPWHCVMMCSTTANNTKSTSHSSSSNHAVCRVVEGDVITIDETAESGRQVLSDLDIFFDVEGNAHRRICVDVATTPSSSIKCVCYVATGKLHDQILNTSEDSSSSSSYSSSSLWTRVLPAADDDDQPTSCCSTGTAVCRYVSSSQIPALPLHRAVMHFLNSSSSNNNNSNNNHRAALSRRIQQIPARVRPNRCPRIQVVILDGAADSHTPHQPLSLTPLEAACNHGKNKNSSDDNSNNAGDGLSVITRNGVSGMMDPFEPGIACGSDTAHLNLFGFPPHIWYRGRGAFEALGAGMTMNPESDIAFKSNFATIDDDTGIVVRRRCDRNFTKEGPLLCEYLDGLTVDVDHPHHHDGDGENSDDDNNTTNTRYTVNLKYATEHRCGVVVSGEGLTDKISGTDPLVDGKPLVKCAPLQLQEEREGGSDAQQAEIIKKMKQTSNQKRTCAVIEAVSSAIRKKISAHPLNDERRAAGKPPANVVLLRGAAQTAPNPSFEAISGFRSFVVAPTCIISGFARSVGMDVVDAATRLGATGDVHSNLDAKATVSNRVFADGEFGVASSSSSNDHPSAAVYNMSVVHVKGCDDAGHDGHPDVKADVLARAGRMMQALWDAQPDGTAFLVFADHSTPCAHMDHGCDPVPVSFAIKKAATTSAAVPPPLVDAAQTYTELDCMQNGMLGRFKGSDMFRILKLVILHQLA